MRFEDVIGQLGVKKKLQELIQHNRLSHALLFLGNEGVGGLPLALAFAQYLVCERVNLRSGNEPVASLFETPPANGPLIIPPDSCGICPACQKAAKLVHPDIHFSYPTVTRKPGEKPVATDFITEWREFVFQQPYGNMFDWIEHIKEKENSQGKITAAECDDILRKLSLKSFESEYKVLIMWMPEEMEKEGNKLLKIIEEPPPNTLFILVSENEEMMLQTIVSRCQLIRIPSLSDSEIEQALISRSKTETSTAAQVAAIAEGNYREALQLLQHADEDWQSLLREWLNAMLKSGPVHQAKWVEEISRLGREKQKQFLRYFNHLLELAIHLRVHGTLGVNRGATEIDFAQRLNKIAAIEQQHAMVEELDKASYYIERNANGKMLFHALTIKLYHIIQDKILVT
jgi:DNA polymerase-3 subunit delta'